MSLKNRIIRIGTKLYVFRKLIKIELSHKRFIPLSTAIKLWTKGFFSKSYVLYNLKENNIHDYLSDVQENVHSKWIIADKRYMDDKLIFPKLIAPFTDVPEDIAIIVRGKLCSISLSSSSITASSLQELLSKEKNLILKPIDGASGDGIIRLEYKEGKMLWNNMMIDISSFSQRLKQLHNYLISRYIIQGDYSNAIYPRTVNTVRILTMIHPDTGKAFIAAAAHRIGTDQSFPVDNCATGGLTANIHTETGILGKGVSTKVKSSTLTWHTHHPDSGAPIEGQQIPAWQELKKRILAIADNLCFIPYVGWDIVITNNGFTIIEGNDGPDIKLHQVHQPLLNNPDIKRFYKYHKVL